MNLERIVWVDSGWNYCNVWSTIDEIIHMAKEWSGHQTTVGFVVYEDDDRVVLVQTLDGERPNATNAWLVYKETIIEREVLG
jgi:hypothetical protein